MLKTRVITAIFIIIYISSMLYIGGWFYNLSALTFALIGMYEIYNAFSNIGHNPIKSVGYLSILFYFYFLVTGQDPGGLLTIILATMISLSVLIYDQKRSPIDAALTVLGLVYPGIISLCLISLKDSHSHYGVYIVILTYLSTWSSDTFAYFVGSKLGKNKLSPTISPKKTIEGSIGGLIGSIIVSMILGALYKNHLGIELVLIHYIVIGILTSIFGQLGDLTASCIKRYCGIKDFGKILPGHGGLLDRFDSILFAIPVIFVYYFLFF